MKPSLLLQLVEVPGSSIFEGGDIDIMTVVIEFGFSSGFSSAFALSKPESESSVESKSLSSDENPALKASVLSWR
jgi:hypothetical protein